MRSKADLVCVDPKIILHVWPKAKALIQAAIERTGLSDFAGIEADVLNGDQLLWLAISDRIEAAALTHLVKSNGRLVLEITACSGARKDRWLAFRERIERYARDEGCACVRFYGRRGWQRVLPDYRVNHVIMEKAL